MKLGCVILFLLCSCRSVPSSEIKEEVIDAENLKAGEVFLDGVSTVAVSYAHANLEEVVGKAEKSTKFVNLYLQPFKFAKNASKSKPHPDIVVGLRWNSTLGVVGKQYDVKPTEEAYSSAVSSYSIFGGDIYSGTFEIKSADENSILALFDLVGSNTKNRVKGQAKYEISFDILR